MENCTRRAFVAASGAAMAASVGLGGMAGRTTAQDGAAAKAAPGDNHRGPCFIASGNGGRVTARSMELMRGGTYLLDAIVDGIRIIEDDPEDDSVGYGGLPNEEGVVQLDASLMDGPSHRAGAVGALENIKNPAAVALQVLRRTGHVMLVGEGALRFARAMGFKEENLLTDRSREAWLRWKAQLNKDDWWLDRDQQIKAPGGPPAPRSALDVPHTSGTVHCSGVDEQGRMASCTSTSGLSWKIPGRLGDSPIVGAGMYCDNEIGAAGATGRGESVIQVCGAFSVVQHMAAGRTPTEACLAVLKTIAEKTKEPRLLDEQGRPRFNVTFYALRKDGAYGSASLLKGGSYAVNDGRENRRVGSEFLFDAAG